jgi:hypothetical protein
MIEYRRQQILDVEKFKNMAEDLQTRVGQKQLYYLTRKLGHVEILTAWENDLMDGTLAAILSEHSFFRYSAANRYTANDHGIPEFIHASLIPLIEKQSYVDRN